MQSFFLQDKNELVSRIKLTIKLRIIFLVSLLFLAPVLVYFLKLGEKSFLRIVSLILIWITGCLIFEKVISQKKLSTNQIERIYFISAFFEYILFVLISYLFGGIGWVGFFYGAIALNFIFLCVEPKKIFTFAFYIVILTGLFFYLEWEGFIPHQKFFEFDLSRNTAYVITTFIAFAGFVLSVALNLNNFSQGLNMKSEEIFRVYKEIDELKNTLEVRIEARKREFEELVKGLDEEVKRKKTELKKKIEELELVNKKIIERELEIARIKKEIKSLKEETKG